MYRSHIRVQFGGQFFDTEIWSCSLNMTIGSSIADQPPEPILDLWEQWTRDNIDDIASDVGNYVEDPGAFFSEAAYLDYVKVNVIGPDGRYRNQSETQAVYFTGTNRARGTTAPGPAQIALVVSTLTAATRGRASRGRYYVPIGSAGVDAGTGRITTAICESAAASASAFLGNLNNQPAIDVNNPRVVVASDLGNPGPQRDVTAVAVGNVLDTQRRRRNALPEVYSPSPVVI